MNGLLDHAFMRHALLAALLVGIVAPAVGTYLVQRRQAIMGDGIGHVALTGVALGFLLRTSPVWTAVAVSALGAVGMELIRTRRRAGGDLALALLLYGGMAGGGLLISLAPGASTASLTGYLWGSILTVSHADLVAMAALTVLVAAFCFGLRRQLFAVCQDEAFARVTGLPVRTLNLLLAVTAAVTVTVSMRVVGLLLVSALMVIPVAAAQRIGRSFAVVQLLAVVVGVLSCVGGTVGSYHLDLPSGPTIVVAAMALLAGLAVLAAVRPVLARARTGTMAQGESVRPRAHNREPQETR
ncbi:zinc transport system permease protein [Streptacidiphilus sp. MAP12-33]